MYGWARWDERDEPPGGAFEGDARHPGPLRGLPAGGDRSWRSSFGHWFISIIHWPDGLIYQTSAMGVTSYLWLGTWVFQVMPIFFFVGGFSNMVTFDAYARRGEHGVVVRPKPGGAAAEALARVPGRVDA